MSTIKSTQISARVNNPSGGLYNVKLPTDIVTADVNKTGTVLVSFRQSNSGSDWMALPYAIDNNFWVYGYGIDATGMGYVTIANNNGDFPEGADFKIVTIEVDD